MTTLFIVSTPIGNPKDISIRALEVLRNSDLIIGEEWKTTSKFLKSQGIEADFEILNEHTTSEELEKLFQKLKSKSNVTFISDCGTPILEDPGNQLINKCLRDNIVVQAVPGANALITALVLSGFPVSPFTFFGFLPREKEERKLTLQKQIQLKHTLVWYETPYRYKAVVEDLGKIISKDKKIFLGLNLTMENEIQFRGSLKDLLEKLDTLPKAEPVIILNNR